MKSDKIKMDLHRFIDNIDDEELLEEIHYIIKSSIDGPGEKEWDELPEDVKAGILEGLAQADRGEVRSYEEVKKRLGKWFSK